MYGCVWFSHASVRGSSYLLNSNSSQDGKIVKSVCIFGDVWALCWLGRSGGISRYVRGWLPYSLGSRYYTPRTQRSLICFVYPWVVQVFHVGKKNATVLLFFLNVMYPLFYRGQQRSYFILKDVKETNMRMKYYPLLFNMLLLELILYDTVCYFAP